MIKLLEEYEIFATLKGEEDYRIDFGNWQAGIGEPDISITNRLWCKFEIQVISSWYMTRTNIESSCDDLWDFITLLEKVCLSISGSAEAILGNYDHSFGLKILVDQLGHPIVSGEQSKTIYESDPDRLKFSFSSEITSLEKFYKSLRRILLETYAKYEDK